jgi:hypothetical protein
MLSKKNISKLFIVLFLTGFGFTATAGDGKTAPATNSTTTEAKNPDNKSEVMICATFHVNNFSVQDDGTVTWSTTNESGSLPYYVEQFVFDRWVRVAEIKGNGTPYANTYSAKILLHSGENKIRVRQKGYDKTNRFSVPVNFISKKAPVSLTDVHKKKAIAFLELTYVQVYDPYGRVIFEGKTKSIDYSSYEKGEYCIIYDNRLENFNVQ